MDIKIIDEYKLKKENKIRDDSLKEHISSLDSSKVIHVRLIRSINTGEIILWETHYRTTEKSKKEVSK